MMVMMAETLRDVANSPCTRSWWLFDTGSRLPSTLKGKSSNGGFVTKTMFKLIFFRTRYWEPAFCRKLVCWRIFYLNDRHVGRDLKFRTFDLSASGSGWRSGSGSGSWIPDCDPHTCPPAVQESSWLTSLTISSVTSTPEWSTIRQISLIIIINENIL